MRAGSPGRLSWLCRYYYNALPDLTLHQTGVWLIFLSLRLQTECTLKVSGKGSWGLWCWSTTASITRGRLNGAALVLCGAHRRSSSQSVTVSHHGFAFKRPPDCARSELNRRLISARTSCSILSPHDVIRTTPPTPPPPLFPPVSTPGPACGTREIKHLHGPTPVHPAAPLRTTPSSATS